MAAKRTSLYYSFPSLRGCRKAIQQGRKKYHDESDTSVTEHPEPPGFWGNKDDGRKLHTVIRNTSYTIEWDDRSRLEILVGSELKTRYNH
ncbi:hypothetical protein ACFQE6_34190, partial [Natrinema soli]